MTRDEYREKCIDKMRDAFFEMQRELGYTPQRDHPDPRICMIAAFDALKGAAWVIPVESTNDPRVFDIYDDLTNAPTNARKTKPAVRLDAAELKTIEEVNRLIRTIISAAQVVWPDYRARLAVTNPPETK